MDGKKLNIFNPDDIPFGPLSNNYLQMIIVNKDAYKSVTHFIYANLVNTPFYKLVIKNQKFANDIRPLYEKFTKEITDDLVRSSFIKAAVETYKNPDMQKALLSTGDSILLYKSPNPLLGTGQDGTGRNIAGNTLMELRKIIKKEKQQYEISLEQQKKLYSLYLIYSVVNYLINSINSGKNNLEEFQNLNAVEIAQKIGKTTLESSSPTFEVFVDVYNKKYITDLDIITTEYEKPGNIANMIRKKYVKNYNGSIIETIKNDLMYFYLSDLISKNYPSVKNHHNAISLELSKINEQERNEIRERLYKLYEAGILPIRPRQFPKMYNEQEIKDIQSLQIVDIEQPPLDDIIFIEGKEGKEEKEGKKGDEKEIAFYEPDGQYGFLSPMFYSGFITIDSHTYPTISHYVLFSLIASIPTIKFNKARSLILVDPQGNQNDPNNYKNLGLITREYEELKQTTITDLMVNLLTDAYTVKFRDQDMKELLVSTAPKMLVYNDKQDSLLGMGSDGKGSNLSGRILTELRKTFIEQGIKAKKLEDKIKSLAEMLSENKRLNQWVEMRLYDAVRSIRAIQRFLEDKLKKTVAFDKKLTSFVVTNLYAKCMNIYLGVTETNVPKDFADKLDIFKDKFTITKQSVKVLWNYISALIYNLLKHFADNNITKENINKAFDTIYSSIKSNKATCPGPYKSPYSNCVLSAIKNISDSIIFFTDKVYQTKVELDEDLLHVSTKILLPRAQMKGFEYEEVSTDENETVVNYLFKDFSPDNFKTVEYINGFIEEFSKVPEQESEKHYEKMITDRVNRLMFFSTNK